MKHILRIASIVWVSFALVESVSVAQVRVTGGVKAWYASWNITFAQESGMSVSDFSSALLAGPFLSVRSGSFSATVSYSVSSTPAKGTETNTGFYFLPAYAGNRTLTRNDINVFVSHNLAPEFMVFGNLKLLTYELRSSLKSIYDVEFTSRQKATGTAAGAGIQITIPFSGGSPLYSFMSTGVLYNKAKTDDLIITIGGNELVITGSSESGSEVLYFLDAGLGYRFLPSNLGAAIGIRVENGPDTKTIIGPTANFFYTF